MSDECRVTKVTQPRLCHFRLRRAQASRGTEPFPRSFCSLHHVRCPSLVGEPTTQKETLMLRLICIALTTLLCAGFIASTFAADVPGAQAIANITPAKAASTQPSNTNVTGTITFTQQDADLHVVGDITGL